MSAEKEKENEKEKKTTTICDLLLRPADLKKIGSGSFATVYKVQIDTGHHLALRVWRIDTEERQEIAQNEIKFAQLFQNQNIAWVPQLHMQSSCMIDGVLYFFQLQELFDGDIASYLKPYYQKQFLSNPVILPSLSILDKMLYIAIQLGRKRILHPDIKPDNFLYRHDNQNNFKIVATDFGHTTQLTASTRQTLRLGWTQTYWECKSLTLQTYDDPRWDETQRSILTDVQLQLLAIYLNIMILLESVMRFGIVRWIDTDSVKYPNRIVWMYGFVYEGKGQKFFNQMIQGCPKREQKFQAKVQQIDQVYETYGKSKQELRRYARVGVFEEEDYNAFLSLPMWN